MTKFLNNKTMLERILKNWKTTAIAIVLFIACIVLVWFEKVSLTGMSGFLSGGALLFLKDKRIFEHWMTTVLGVIVIAMGFVFVWYGKANLTALYGFYLSGIGLFFAKDNKEPDISPLVVILLACTAISCSTYGKTMKVTERVVRDTTFSIDTHYIAVKVPGETKYITQDKIVYDTITIYNIKQGDFSIDTLYACLLYTSPSPRDVEESRMPSSA